MHQAPSHFFLKLLLFTYTHTKTQKHIYKKTVEQTYDEMVEELHTHQNSIKSTHHDKKLFTLEEYSDDIELKCSVI